MIKKAARYPDGDLSVWVLSVGFAGNRRIIRHQELRFIQGDPFTRIRTHKLPIFMEQTTQFFRILRVIFQIIDNKCVAEISRLGQPHPNPFKTRLQLNKNELKKKFRIMILKFRKFRDNFRSNSTKF